MAQLRDLGAVGGQGGVIVAMIWMANTNYINYYILHQKQTKTEARAVAGSQGGSRRAQGTGTSFQGPKRAEIRAGDPKRESEAQWGTGT